MSRAVNADWTDFKMKNIGPEKRFEKLMYDLLCHEIDTSTCDIWKTDGSHGGDDGIDVLVRKGSDIEVYQCKFFLYRIEETQWKQIRDSFERITNWAGDGIKVLHWYLCTPFTPGRETKEISDKWNKYRLKWKNQYGIDTTWINGEAILLRMEKAGIIDDYFLEDRTETREDRKNEVTTEAIGKDELEAFYSSEKEKRSTSFTNNGDFYPYPTEYLRLYGTFEVHENEGRVQSYYLDLLDWIVKPSCLYCKNKHNGKVFLKVDHTGNDEGIREVKEAPFKIIYGYSCSGLSYLCKNAFQTFLHYRDQMDFCNLAYFSIEDEDVNLDNLYKKLLINGRTVFSAAFDNGLIILDGLGKVLQDLGYISDLIDTLIASIKSLLIKYNVRIRFLITVRSNIENHLGDFIQVEQDHIDVKCVRNTMLDNKGRRQAIRGLSNVNPRRRLWYLTCFEYDSIQKIDYFHGLLKDANRNDADEECSNLAYKIFETSIPKYTYLTLEQHKAILEQISFIAIEGDRVGFGSQKVLEYYVALYIFKRFKEINTKDEDAKSTTVALFLKAISCRGLTDKQYTEVSRKSVTFGYRLILVLLKDMCMRMDNKERRKIIDGIFDYLETGKTGFLSHDNYGRAIRSFFIVYRNSDNHFDDTIVRKVHYALRNCVFRNLVFPNIYLHRIQDERFGLDYATIEDSIIPSFEFGDSYSQTSMRYVSFEGTRFNQLTIRNADISFCNFKGIIADNVEFDENTSFRHASFANGKLKNARFKGTKFFFTNFEGLEVTKHAFDGAFIDGKPFNTRMVARLGITFQ